ncbi:ABC transporter ATP-binding protein [Haloferax volcanii]|uniref:ABC transporter ATP-binding protein n=2 Tax=Haloferax volcanii TaxID=2246 RepID=A0A8T5CGS9_HALVO|nr:ABC transporter ATP-binding protein [Haloferax volcanii]ADE02141.1 ABC-type transport system ATP-binding protein (probable substrate dipeptide/oligopeptide) [Haloferax volcanii DS2]MBS8121177.1 ABC transporter ATP-binding protein [Haloferax volcanii]MBS8126187.1 ABC transporter ATP-binding protein [Haloferax volcanii]MBS8130056.1 ABC transporter ATP-binding protein [Haloferax volcanii]MBS8133920.1 ABC transporter ATP-binding protein [Haloferax volcanii]
MSSSTQEAQRQEDTHSEPLLSIQNLKKYYPITKGMFQRHVGDVKAVDDVSVDIYPGETHGLVGESGCGKSTLLETIIGLKSPTDGEVLFRGTPLTELSQSEVQDLRKEIQIVFQNPDSSLNSRMTVERIVSEPLQIHSNATSRQITARVLELIHEVGLNTEHLTRFPHELSGGQKQRVAIARALATNPSLVVLDEPTSALDVSVQSQILNMLDRLKEEHNLTYIFVTHDLSVVRHIADRISVMYLGNVVERAPVNDLFETPRHPYTKALLSAVPVPDPDYDATEDIVLSGDVPDPSEPPNGCRFHPRCPIATEDCKEGFPEFEAHGETLVRCIRVDEGRGHTESTN